MFAEIHSSQSDSRVHVVGCGDDDGVDIFLALEHFAKVGVVRGFGRWMDFS